jgi:hypothetical protein
MREQQTYIEFQKAATTQALSEEQALQLDAAQIKQMAKAEEAKLSENFIRNMKTLAAEEIRAQKDQSTLDRIKALLQPEFPNLQGHIHRDESGPVVTLYLQAGKE